MIQRIELTDKEAMECIARWINFLYTAWFHDHLLSDEHIPCCYCPRHKTCTSNGRIGDGRGPIASIPWHFHVLDQYIGPNKVIDGYVAPNYEAAIEDVISRYK